MREFRRPMGIRKGIRLPSCTDLNRLNFVEVEKLRRPAVKAYQLRFCQPQISQIDLWKTCWRMGRMEPGKNRRRDMKNGAELRITCR